RSSGFLFSWTSKGAPPPAPRTPPITALLPAPEPPSACAAGWLHVSITAWDGRPSGGATTAVAPFCVPSYPDLFATTTPVRSAVTTTRPSPMAVIFQGFHPVLVMGDLRLWRSVRRVQGCCYP